VNGRVLETAEEILYNLQKGIVDSTISTAAELEKGSSPYYKSPSHLNQNSIETNESSSNY
jgi:hypothetical protein